MLGDILIRDILELLRSLIEFLSDLAGKLDYRHKIANAETKTHRDIKHSSVIDTPEGGLRGSGESKKNALLAS
jgi:hypothetical protein